MPPFGRQQLDDRSVLAHPLGPCMLRVPERRPRVLGDMPPRGAEAEPRGVGVDRLQAQLSQVATVLAAREGDAIVEVVDTVEAIHIGVEAV